LQFDVSSNQTENDLILILQTFMKEQGHNYLILLIKKKQYS